MAKKLFGDENPIGKTLSIVNNRNKEFSYTVSAVFADLPQNSSFRIDILTHLDNFLLMWDLKDTDWKIWTTALFIVVPDKSLLPSITQSLKNYLPVQNRAREDFRINRFILIPLKEVGANTRSTWSSGLFPSLHPAAIIAYRVYCRRLSGYIWDYFVEIRAGILLLSASIVFIATMLTILFKITKASMRNPAVSLRYE